MPSSTSSSRLRLWELLCALCLALVIALGVEMLWRKHGYQPEPNDNADAWTAARQSVYGPNVLALAGSSRFQADLKLSTLRHWFPQKRVVQLSLSGGCPLTILKNLAADPKFHGDVLCEVLPHLTYTDIDPPDPFPHYSQRPAIADFESSMRVRLTPPWTIFLPEYSVQNVAGNLLLRRAFPAPSRHVADAERELHIDFSGVDTAPLRKEFGDAYMTAGKTLTPEACAKRLEKVNEQVQNIQRRGGSVVFFQMPSSDRVREAETTRFPDETTWEVFRRTVQAPTFRYCDTRELNHFDCPDGGHLDFRDAEAFTNALCTEITRRHLLTDSAAK